MSITLFVILILLVLGLLVIVLLAWYLLSPVSKQTSAKTDTRTQPVVQRFLSEDLKKRALIIQLHEVGYKIVFQRYSNKVINLAGEVAGWQTLPEKHATESLASAVEIAQNWVHTND